MSVIVNIDVPALGPGEVFYCDGLGFHRVRRLFDGAVAQVERDDFTAFLIAAPAGSIAVAGSDVQRAYSDHWTPLHLDIAVPDLEFSLRRALDAGARQTGAVTTHVFGRMARLRDPFGHGFCLIEFSARGYDAAADVIPS